MNKTLGELDRMTQQNAALVEEAAASAESLNEHFGRRTRAVRTFRVDEAIPG